mmetsp:Transcript_88486/g.255242  ORF Transcript_88486/g.255242 Transcript_88486/m.255242 type:complete len:284 (+) Transcript_88486:742-1593(+)
MKSLNWEHSGPWAAQSGTWYTHVPPSWRVALKVSSTWSRSVSMPYNMPSAPSTPTGLRSAHLVEVTLALSGGTMAVSDVLGDVRSACQLVSEPKADVGKMNASMSLLETMAVNFAIAGVDFRSPEDPPSAASTRSKAASMGARAVRSNCSRRVTLSPVSFLTKIRSIKFGFSGPLPAMQLSAIALIWSPWSPVIFNPRPGEIWSKRSPSTASRVRQTADKGTVATKHRPPTNKAGQMQQMLQYQPHNEHHAGGRRCKVTTSANSSLLFGGSSQQQHDTMDTSQ